MTTPSPQAVSRCLGRQHDRSRTVRGRLADNSTEGFKVRRWLDEVRVSWIPDTHGWEISTQGRAPALAAYTQTLQAAGYTVSAKDEYLIITVTTRSTS